jgi:hypothetical protein
MLRPTGNLRKSARCAMRHVGEMILWTHAVRFPCKVLDMSEGGARLSISRTLPRLAHTFTLALFKDGSLNRDCKIVWTDGRSVGVKFTSDWYSGFCKQTFEAGGGPRNSAEKPQRS